MDKIFFPDSNVFQQLWTIKVQTAVSQRFRFCISNTSSVKVVLNTAAAEASCCFSFISGVIVEAEMYDTDNKRSLDLSE